MLVPISVVGRSHCYETMSSNELGKLIELVDSTKLR